MTTVVTFDDFEPGTVLGESTEAFDPVLSEGWQRIFGARLKQPPGDGGATDGAGSAGSGGGGGGMAEGASIAVVMMMRAYLAVVAPRPPGNIHASQGFTLAAPLRPGERIRTVVTCAGKEMRRGRRYVELRTEGTGEGGRPVFTGRMTLIWAA